MPNASDAADATFPAAAATALSFAATTTTFVVAVAAAANANANACTSLAARAILAQCCRGPTPQTGSA